MPYELLAMNVNPRLLSQHASDGVDGINDTPVPAGGSAGEVEHVRVVPRRPPGPRLGTSNKITGEIYQISNTIKVV